jgi:hypothetical protein
VSQTAWRFRAPSSALALALACLLAAAALLSSLSTVREPGSLSEHTSAAAGAHIAEEGASEHTSAAAGAQIAQEGASRAPAPSLAATASGTLQASASASLLRRLDSATGGSAVGISFPRLRSCLKGEHASRTAADCIEDALVRRDGDCTSDLQLSSSLKAVLDTYSAMSTARRSFRLDSVEHGQVLRVYNLNKFEGLGDHFMGYSHSILMALLSRRPKALVIDDLPFLGTGNVPLTLTWAPCPCANGLNWTMPAEWTAALTPHAPLEAEGTLSVGMPCGRGGGLYSSGSFRARNATHKHIRVHNCASNKTFFSWMTHEVMGDSTTALTTFLSNQRSDEFGALNPLPDDALAWLGSDAARPGSVCARYPPELAAIKFGVETGRLCAGAAPDEASTAYSLRPSASIGAGGRELGLQLFDYLFWPTAAIVARVATSGLLAHYDPKDQYIIAVHLRIGTAAANASYRDRPRDSIERAVPAAVTCARKAMSRLSDRFGARTRFLWYVASDRPDALQVVRDALRERANTSFAGLTVQVVDLGVKDVVHTGKSSAAHDALSKGFVDSFTDHFMLSAAHAMVRSSSGFSLSAQLIGRVVDVAYQPADDSSCVDVSSTGAVR